MGHVRGNAVWWGKVLESDAAELDSHSSYFAYIHLPWLGFFQLFKTKGTFLALFLTIWTF